MPATEQSTAPAENQRVGEHWRLIGKFISIGVVVVGLTLLLMVLAGFFHRKIPVDGGKTPQSDLSKVSLVEVRVIRQPRYEAAVGTIRAVHEAAVASRLLARVVEVNVKAGQAVSQGDILVRLDDADLRARNKQAESALATAKTNFEQARLEYKRAAALQLQKSMPREEYERAAARFRTTESEMKRTEQALDESKVLLDFATVRAPLTGIVIDKKVEVGDTVVPGQALLTLFNPGKMQMLASVRESLALKLKVGQKVPGRIESMEHECEATISEIVPEAQAASRSFTVKVVGPCPPGIYSGMFGRIYIPLEDEEITVVPAAAIKRVGQLEMVQFAEDGALRRRNVQSGRTIGSDVEILSGLRPGERVALPVSDKEIQP